MPAVLLKEKLNINRRMTMLLVVLAYAISLIFSRIYSSSIDNYIISCVLHGVFDSDNYCFYLHPFIAAIVKFLNSVFPNADFFCFLQIFCVYTGFIWFQICLSTAISNNRNYGLLSIYSLCFAIILDLAHSNFTVTAAFFTFVGFYSLILFGVKKISFRGYIIGLIFSCLGLMWRFESFLLILPFFLLSTSVSLLLYKEKKRQLFITLFSLAVVICGLLFLKNMVDRQPENTTGIAYNEARSDLQDYPLPEYETAEILLSSAGISKNDYIAVKNYFLLDTAIVNTDFLSSILRCIDGIYVDSFSQIIDEFKDNTTSSSFLSIIILLITVLYLFINSLVCNANPLLRLEVICTALGTIVIIVYFVLTGRILDRLIVTVLLGTLLPFLTRLDSFSFPKIKWIKHSIADLTVPLALLCTLFIFIYRKPSCQNVFSVDTKVDYGSYSAVLNNQNLYIWDEYYYKTMLEDTLIPQGKLLTQSFTDNNIPDGLWLYGQPYFNNYLSSFDYKNPIEALLYQSNCFYIARRSRIDTLIQFIREHYDENASAEFVEDIIVNDRYSFSVFSVKSEKKA